MKRFIGIIAIFVFPFPGIFLGEDADSKSRIASLRAEYEERKAGVSSDQKDFDASYVRELKKLEKKAIDAGDLELVVAIREAAKIFTAGKRDVSISAHPELARMQKIYVDQTIRITAERNTNLRSLAKDYRAKLIDLRVELTKGGEIDSALKVQEEIDRIGKEAPVRAVVARVSREFQQGLVVSDFKRLEKQVRDKGFVRFEELRAQPLVGEKRLINSLRNWAYAEGRNAIAAGYLKVEQPGEYRFNSNSFYDRNALYILNEDRPLCGYRDGEGKIQKVSLPRGMVRIISIGYVDARGHCNVRWKPPGEENLSPIPGDLLFHTDADKRN